MILTYPSTRRQALVRGFWKGLAAPVMLFGVGAAPIIPEPIQISPPGLTGEDALRSDWTRLGVDFQVVIANEKRA